MQIVFLTGLIGSGKSSAGLYLASKGAYRIDLDQLSRKVFERYPECVKHLQETFGSDIARDSLQVNRQLLAERAFVNAETQTKLEQCTVPFIKQLLREELNALSIPRQLKSNQDQELLKSQKACRFDSLVCSAPLICVVEIPLLDRLEDMLSTADHIVYVEAPRSLRRIRAHKRGMNPSDFDARTQLQPSEAYLDRCATYKIVNTATTQDFESQLDQLWEYLIHCEAD